MSFLRKCFNLQPFIVGLVGLQHKLQNTSHDREITQEVQRLRARNEARRRRQDGGGDLDRRPTRQFVSVLLPIEEECEEEEECVCDCDQMQNQNPQEMEAKTCRCADDPEDHAHYEKEKRKQDTRRIIQEDLRNANTYGLAIAINVNGKERFKESYGMNNIENQIKATPDMRGNIGSVTKLFTAYLIMRLFETGTFGKGRFQRLFLDDNIQHEEGILDPEDEHTFTLAQLMHHTADIRHYAETENHGVRQYASMKLVWDDSLYEYFLPDNPNKLFGRRYVGARAHERVVYSSLGYDVLGLFLELNDEESFEIFRDNTGPAVKPFYNIMTDEVRRINLRNTALHTVDDIKFDFSCGYGVCYNGELQCDAFETQYLKEIRKMEDLPIPDVFEEDGLEDADYMSQLHNCGYVNYSHKYPSEGLIGNVGDLIKFGDMFLRMEQGQSNGGPLSPSLAKLMWSYNALEEPKYWPESRPVVWQADCLGFQVFNNFYRRRQFGNKKEYKMWVYHSGSAVGYTSELYITTLKEENYLLIKDREYAAKAILPLIWPPKDDTVMFDLLPKIQEKFNPPPTTLSRERQAQSMIPPPPPVKPPSTSTANIRFPSPVSPGMRIHPPPGLSGHPSQPPPGIGLPPGLSGHPSHPPPGIGPLPGFSGHPSHPHPGIAPPSGFSGHPSHLDQPPTGPSPPWCPDHPPQDHQPPPHRRNPQPPLDHPVQLLNNERRPKPAVDLPGRWDRNQKNQAVPQPVEKSPPPHDQPSNSHEGSSSSSNSNSSSSSQQEGLVRQHTAQSKSSSSSSSSGRSRSSTSSSSSGHSHNRIPQLRILHSNAPSSDSSYCTCDDASFASSGTYWDALSRQASTREDPTTEDSSTNSTSKSDDDPCELAALRHHEAHSSKSKSKESKETYPFSEETHPFETYPFSEETYPEDEMEEMDMLAVSNKKKDQIKGITVAVLSNFDRYWTAEQLSVKLSELYMDELDVVE